MDYQSTGYLQNPFNNPNKKKYVMDVNKNRRKIIKIAILLTYLIITIYFIRAIIIVGGDIESIKKDNANLQVEINQQKKVNLAANEEVQGENTVIQGLEKTKKDILTTESQLQKNLEEAKKKSTQADPTQIQKLTQKLNEIKQNIKDSTSELDFATTNLNNLKSQIKTKTDKLNTLKTKLQNLQEAKEKEKDKPKKDDPPIIIPPTEDDDKDVTFDSEILPDKKYLHQLENLLQIKAKVTTKLLYRASKDGFNPTNMHNKIDGKSNILSLIYNTDRSVIGGFSTASWEGSGFKNDKTARIFNMNSNKLYVVSNVDEAIYCDPKYFIVYGRGDIMVNGDGKVYSNFPVSYGIGYDQKYEILGGSDSLVISEIEIFQVIPIKNS